MVMANWVRPWIRVLEHDDPGLTLGVVPGDLDGVFHAFGAAVGEKQRLLRGIAPGVAAASFSARRTASFVGADHEAGVGEFLRLGLDGRHHLGMAVPHVHHGDATGKIDIVPAFHIR